VERLKVLPARLYQRYRSFFDRIVPALGMACLFLLADQATEAFPLEWRLSIAGGIVVASLVEPIAGYLLFMLALSWPLYSISIYIAALSLTLLVLMAFFVKRHLAALVLVLAVPLLVPYRIAPVVPLLAGLWWGEWGGMLGGLGGAFWLKLFAGMCGATPHLTQLGGQSLDVSHLISRFHVANSLQTLAWMVDPQAPSSQVLLLHILEILGWALAGYGVGLVRQRLDGMRQPAVGLVASVSAGILGAWLGLLGLPMALGLRDALVLSVPFVVEYCWSGGIAIGVYGVYRHLNRPAVVPLPSRVEPYRSTVRPAPEPDPTPWVRPQSDDDEQAGIIMIDLD